VDFGLAQRLSKSESSEQQSVNDDITSEQNGRLLLEAVTDKQVVIFTFFPIRTLVLYYVLQFAL